MNDGQENTRWEKSETTQVFEDDDGMQVQENWAADGFVNMVGADAV